LSAADELRQLRRIRQNLNISGGDIKPPRARHRRPMIRSGKKEVEPIRIRRQCLDIADDQRMPDGPADGQPAQPGVQRRIQIAEPSHMIAAAIFLLHKK